MNLTFLPVEIVSHLICASDDPTPLYDRNDETTKAATRIGGTYLPPNLAR